MELRWRVFKHDVSAADVYDYHMKYGVSLQEAFANLSKTEPPVLQYRDESTDWTDVEVETVVLKK